MTRNLFYTNNEDNLYKTENLDHGFNDHQEFTTTDYTQAHPIDKIDQYVLDCPDDNS